MSTFKPQQHHLLIQGRAFHFVSYEGQPANVTKQQEARPAMWYLMVEGRRFPAMPLDPQQNDLEVQRFLTNWAISNALAEPAPEVAAAAPSARARGKRPRR